MGTTIHYRGDDNMIELMSELDVHMSLPEIKACLVRIIWENQSPLLSDVISEIAGREKRVSEPFREQIWALWNELTRHRNADFPFCFQKFAGPDRAEDLVARAHWRLREVRMLMPLFGQAAFSSGVEAKELKNTVISSLEKLSQVLDSLQDGSGAGDLPKTEGELQRIDSSLEAAFNRLGQLCLVRE